MTSHVFFFGYRHKSLAYVIDEGLKSDSFKCLILIVLFFFFFGYRHKSLTYVIDEGLKPDSFKFSILIVCEVIYKFQLEDIPKDCETRFVKIVKVSDGNMWILL